MRNRLWLLQLVLVAVGLCSCSLGPEADQQPPLLLEEPAETQESLPLPEGPVADNSRCFVCHINYAEEELAVTHARANISCEDCHGESDAHCSNEDNITPPDIMYAKEKINSSCLECHPRDTLSDVHKPILAGTANEKYCTDCHGQHRLTYRTRQWDKVSGELMKDDGVRMMTEEPIKKK